MLDPIGCTSTTGLPRRREMCSCCLLRMHKRTLERGGARQSTQGAEWALCALCLAALHRMALAEAMPVSAPKLRPAFSSSHDVGGTCVRSLPCATSLAAMHRWYRCLPSHCFYSELVHNCKLACLSSIQASARSLSGHMRQNGSTRGYRLPHTVSITPTDTASTPGVPRRPSLLCTAPPAALATPLHQ